MPLDDLEKEVQQKIGRNLLLFQKLERLLKLMVSRGQFSAPINKFKEVLEEKRNRVATQTMGQVAKQYLDNNNPFNREVDDSSDKDDSVISYRIQLDATNYQQTKTELEQLINERNYLVHHLGEKLNDEDIETYQKIGTELDIQANQVASKIKNIGQRLQTIIEFEESSNIHKSIMATIIHQPLITLLVEIPRQLARKDGWTPLSSAAQLLKEQDPEEYRKLYTCKKYKSLKDLMLKAGMFKFHEEKTNKGGVRILYQVKKEWKITIEK